MSAPHVLFLGYFAVGIKMVIGGTRLLFWCFRDVGLRQVWLEKTTEWNSSSIVEEG